MSKTVWIDLENSPHVPFFLPWIPRIREAGHDVVLTARDLSQTHELLRLHGLEFEPVGGHGGGSKLLKASRTLGRAHELVRRLHRRKIDLALGHGSRAQVVAAWWMRIPRVTLLDYEYVSLRLFGLLSTKVFFPESVPAAVLIARGIPRRKLVFYPGFKEQAYLDPEVDRPQPAEPPLILIRPPARRAHYHTEKSERLYQMIVEKLATEATNAQVLFLPRYADEVGELKRLVKRYPHFSLPEGPEPARDLLLKASLVISGGGTMVREAAVLGIPAVSFFGGPVGGVDRALAGMGRLEMLRDETDVARLARRMPPAPGRPGREPSPSESPGASTPAQEHTLPQARLVRDVLMERLSTYL
ncbi:MAG: DUF354 domain-containing protein [Candidatus Eisenbacteria sp.]|nr:DUF354 domain-containing protein [Candidatus Eisenbacteria bacterium]